MTYNRLYMVLSSGSWTSISICVLFVVVGSPCHIRDTSFSKTGISDRDGYSGSASSYFSFLRKCHQPEGTNAKPLKETYAYTVDLARAFIHTLIWSCLHWYQLKVQYSIVLVQPWLLRFCISRFKCYERNYLFFSRFMLLSWSVLPDASFYFYFLDFNFSDD